jgi:hypothetical protein
MLQNPLHFLNFPAAKAYMMAYDKQLKDFATMYDEEAIL